MSQSPEIPERLPTSPTWNCSVPHWPRFQRHFHCNLRQECVGGEDEVQCPYFPCSHGGVSFQGHCYFLAKSSRRRTWLQGHGDCQRAGGYMASLTTPREWGDVMTWLSLDTTWNRVFFGLASASPRLPLMCVENGAVSTCCFCLFVCLFVCFFSSNFLFAFTISHSTVIYVH